MSDPAPWADIPLGKVWDSCQASRDKQYECLSEILRKSAFEKKNPEGLDDEFNRIKTELANATNRVENNDAFQLWWKFPPASIEVVFFSEVSGITDYTNLQKFRNANPGIYKPPQPLGGDSIPTSSRGNLGLHQGAPIRSSSSNVSSHPKDGSLGIFGRGSATNPRNGTSSVSKTTPIGNATQTRQQPQQTTRPAPPQPTRKNVPGAAILDKLQSFRELVTKSSRSVIAKGEKDKSPQLVEFKKHYEYLQMFSVLENGKINDNAVVGLVRCCRTFYEYVRIDFFNATGGALDLPSFQQIVDDPQSAHRDITKFGDFGTVIVGLLLLVFPLKSLSHNLALDYQILRSIIFAKVYPYSLINASFLLNHGNTNKNKYLAATAGSDHPSLRKWMDEDFNANEARNMAVFLAQITKQARSAPPLSREEDIARQRQAAVDHLVKFIAQANAIADPLHPLRLLAERLAQELREERTVLALGAKRALGKQIVVAVANLQGQTLSLLRQLTARRGVLLPQNTAIELVRNELPLVPMVNPPYLPVDPGSENTCVGIAQLYLPSKKSTSDLTTIHIGVKESKGQSLDNVVFVGPSLVDQHGVKLPGLRASLDVLSPQHWRPLVEQMKSESALTITVGNDHPFANKREFEVFVACLKSVQGLQFTITSEDKTLASKTVNQDSIVKEETQPELLNMSPPLFNDEGDIDLSSSLSEYIPTAHLAETLGCEQWQEVLTQCKDAKDSQRGSLIHAAVERVKSKVAVLPSLAGEIADRAIDHNGTLANYRKLCEAEEWDQDLILCNDHGAVVTGFAPRAEVAGKQIALRNVAVPDFLTRISLPETIFGFAHVNAKVRKHAPVINKPPPQTEETETQEEVKIEIPPKRRQEMLALLASLQKHTYIKVYREHSDVMPWAQAISKKEYEKVSVEVNKYHRSVSEPEGVLNRARGRLMDLDKILLVATVSIKIHPATGQMLEKPKEFRAVYNVMPQPFAYNYDFRLADGSIDHSAFLLYCVDLLRFYIKVAAKEKTYMYIPTPAIYFNNNIELQAIFETATYLAATEPSAAACMGLYVSNVRHKLLGDLKLKLGDMIEEARGNLKCPIVVLKDVNATHIPMYTDKIMLCVMGNTESPGKIHGNGFEQQVTRVTMPDIYTVFNNKYNTKIGSGEWIGVV